MRIEKVTDPDQIYVNRRRARGYGCNYKDRYRCDNAWSRFNTRFRLAYGGVIMRQSNYQGFHGYDLNRHDLLGIRQYERTGEIDRMVRERIGEPYLMGVELEIERVRDRERVSGLLRRYLPDRHICVRDGSIASDGIEIVTSPLAPTEIGRVPWYSLLRSLSRSGCSSHDSGQCGLHISISRSYLTERAWRSIRSWLSRERVLFEGLSRRTIGRGNSGDPFNYCRFYPAENKYQALNLSKGAVAEFRFFRGTLNPRSFLASIEIIRSIVEYAKTRDLGDSVRLTTRGWRSFLESSRRFGVACQYLKGHEIAAAAVSTPTPTPIHRRRSSSRAAEFLIARCRGYGLLLSEDGELVGDDRVLRQVGCIGLRDSGNDQVWRIPINWERSLRDYRFPEYIRSAVAAGRAPTEIVVRTRNVAEIGAGVSPISGRSAVIGYRRSGWGSRSYAYIMGVSA